MICFDIQRKERLLRQLANQASDLEKKLDDTEEIVFLEIIFDET